MLTTVTITGADDSVRPENLAQLSATFPFVEWGILFSPKYYGQSRWPSKAWLEVLYETVQDLKAKEGKEMRLSAHLCGQYMRDILMGNADYVTDMGEHIWQMFQRVQINTHGKPNHYHAESMAGWMKYNKDKEFIFQIDNANGHALSAAADMGVNCSGLFDMSHGAGVSPEEWPFPLKDIKCGYAGGIGPDNIEAEIYKIGEKLDGQPIWIDMETKVRSAEDRIFDVGKVLTCLARAQKYVVDTRFSFFKGMADMAGIAGPIKHHDVEEQDVLATIVSAEPNADSTRWKVEVRLPKGRSLSEGYPMFNYRTSLWFRFVGMEEGKVIIDAIRAVGPDALKPEDYVVFLKPRVVSVKSEEKD